VRVLVTVIVVRCFVVVCGIAIDFVVVVLLAALMSLAFYVDIQRLLS
jgi:hypothetical protein